MVKMVFRIVCNTQSGKAQFDEQWWLINGPSEQEALQKARNKGFSEEDSFTGPYTGSVRWKFIEVTDIIQLGELQETHNLLSRIEETDDLKGYLTFVQRKAESISTQTVFSV